jgi:hypothetical protein
MAEFINQEFVRTIVYYIQTDFIKNNKTCSKSCLKINEGIPFDVCKDYCMIKFYVNHFLIIFKMYIIYRLLKNIINKGSMGMAIVYCSILFLI